MKIRLLSAVLIFVFFAINCVSQQHKIDSLLTLIKTEKADTAKLIHLYNVSDECETIGNYEDGLKYGKQALDLADLIISETKNINIQLIAKKYKGKIYGNIGLIYFDQGNYSDALKNHFASINIKEEIGDKKGVSISYNNIGLIYTNQGNYPEALKIYFSALRIMDSIGYKEGVASAYSNIGLIYCNQSDYSMALKNLFLSLKMHERNGDKEGMLSNYNSIGTVYYYQHNFSEALKNFSATLKLSEEIGDKRHIAACYNNIGSVYSDQAELERDPVLRKSKLDEALKNFFSSLKIKEEIGDKSGIGSCYLNIGSVYTEQKKYKEAEMYLIKAKELLKEIGYKEYLKKTYNALTDLDSARGNYEGAYENHKLYILYRDSIDNEETRKKTIQSQMTYDFEKKELATKAEQDKKDAVAAADKKRQQIFFWFLAALAIAIGIIAIVIFRGLQQSKKAKRVIEIQRDEISQQKEMVEHQKIIVEEHQKEIVDSITYAKRIQYTLLANKQLLESNLPEHFVLFKPKDIVSGDFYWATEKSWQSSVNKEEKIKRFYIAACDSTGHGVPGAFMSLLNISFLNEAVNEKNILEPHEILNHVRKRLIENMDGGQDGMDCILLCIENSSFENELNSPLKRGAGGIKITYAAANNSPAIIKNGKLFSLETDKMPVGKGENSVPFTLRTIDLSSYREQNKKITANVAQGIEPKVLPFGEDLGGASFLYLYTDGYADQFGGPKGKKFKYKQLDELLVSMSNLSAAEQSEILDQRFEDWKGNLEQVDDMLVIGIKI